MEIMIKKTIADVEGRRNKNVLKINEEIIFANN